MELSLFEMAIDKLVGKAIVFVIVAWLIHMAINKLVVTLMKGDPNRVRKDDPSSVTSSSDESPPPLAEKDDTPSLPSPSAESPLRAQKHGVFQSFRDVDTCSGITNNLCATSSAFPASAEASVHRWNHEVFLSFRGVDTREGIASTIYDRLQNMRGIKTFMDDQQLEVGDSILPTLLTAIKKSRFAIVVLSQHYADSTWCLEELTTIFQYMKDKNRILPLFYQVNPSDVRHQRGSFEDTFKKHESRHGIKKVKQWKDALRNVANLSGWHSDNYRSDGELVEGIVKLVWSKVLQVRSIEDESTSRDFEAFEATKLAMDKVMEGLKDDEVAVIGMYGIGGVGKTTLVKQACVQARADGLFNKVIMVVVSQSMDLTKIQNQLADMLALNFRQDTEVDRADVIQKAIMRGNKLLIILDDIWSKVPLSSIGIPNNEELHKCNSKVLFTTRMQKVCQEMCSDAKINLSILSENDSWKLFLKKARLSSHESSELHSVAMKVARKCAGLPIALVAVARALRDEQLDKWKGAVERLHRSQPTDPEDEKHPFNCIKFSYDFLRSTYAKSILQLCCLFPEDYDIPIEDLFRYGIGKGLFEESNTLQEARAKADSVVKSLKDSSLLLDSEVNGCLKMHDVIRDVVMSISSSEEGLHMFVKHGQDLIEWPRINADVNYSAISLMDNRILKIPKEMVCSKLLQILSLRNFFIWEFPETFFQSQNELRVLDLRQVYHSDLSKNFSMLTNLRALFIKGCVYGVEELSNLGKLELLSWTEFDGQFPEHLSKLRMLDISKSESGSSFPPKVISRLIGLEELYMKGKFIWGREDNSRGRRRRTNLCCEEFIGLPNLTTLEVQINDVGCLPKVVKFNPHWVKFNINFRSETYEFYDDYLAELPHQDSQKSLCLDTTINNSPDWFIKVVTERAEKLVYYWFRDMKNILVEYYVGRLQGVKYLSVIRCNGDFEWRELMNAVKWKVPDKPVFENLEELHVEEVPCAKLCVGELPRGSFRNLNKLKVLDCSNMKNALFTSNLLKTLQNLEELLCGDLSGIKYVFGTDGMKPEQIIFTKLRKIHLSSLLQLTDICNGPAPLHAVFQNLKYLVVGDCPALKYVFPSRSVVECLVQLEELYVYQCPSLKAVIKANKETDSDDMIEFPELKILFLVHLDQLTRFYGIRVSPRPIINCPKLEQRCLVGSIKFANDALNLSAFRSFKEVHEGGLDDYIRLRERLHKETKARRLTTYLHHRR